MSKERKKSFLATQAGQNDDELAAVLEAQHKLNWKENVTEGVPMGKGCEGCRAMHRSIVGGKEVIFTNLGLVWPCFGISALSPGHIRVAYTT